MDLMATRPLAAVSSEALCTAAEQDRISLWWHAGGVRGCLRQTYADLGRRVLPSFEGPFAQSRRWNDALVAGTLAVAGHLEAEPGAARFFLIDAACAPDHETHLLTQEAHQQLTDALGFAVIRAGDRPPATDLQIEMLAAALPQLLARRVVADGHLRDWERIAADTTQLAEIFGCVVAEQR
jgi:hypothetical protein